MNGSSFAAVAALIIGANVLPLQAAKTCTWTGGSTTDKNWSTPENWGGSDATALPATGDAVVLSNAGSSYEIVNDIDGLTLTTLTFSGTKAFRLSGKPLSLANSFMQNVTGKGVVTTNAVALTLTHNCSVTFAGNTVMSGAVTNLATGTVGMRGTVLNGNYTMRFTAPVYMPNITIAMAGHMKGNVVAFDDALTSTAINGDGGNTANACGAVLFNSAKIAAGAVKIAYTSFTCGVPFALSEHDVIYWQGYSEVQNTYLDLNGNDQSIDRTYSLANSKGVWEYSDKRQFKSSQPATLTLNSTASTVANCMYNGKVSIVYNPTSSDFSHTVTQSVSTTTGKITVSKGTFRVARGATMLNISEIEVADGAAFVYESGTVPSFPNLTKVTLGKTAQLTLPSGTSLALSELTVDGERKTGSGLTHADIPQISEGVYISAGSTLTIDVPSGTTKAIAEALTGQQLADVNNNVYIGIVKTGAGTLTLDQALTYRGEWRVNAGKVHVTAKENGFGPAGISGLDTVYVDYSKNGQAALKLGVSTHVVTVARPIKLIGDPGKNDYFDCSGKVHFEGGVTADDRIGITIRSGSSAEFYGGLTQPSSKLFMMAAASGAFVVGDEPVDIGYFSPIWSTVDFNVPGNKAKELKLQDAVTMTVGCDDAFASPYPNLVMEPVATGIPKMNLNGHALHVGNMTLVGVCGSTPASKLWEPEINSSKPATLAFDQVSVKTNSRVFVRGLVSLDKGGAAEFAFNTNILSTGTLKVREGVFAMTANATWANCTNITVSGSGSTVSLARSDTFHPKAWYVLSDGGKVNLRGASTVQTAKRLYYGAILKSPGTYGSTASDAQFKDDAHFTGEGVLRVTGGLGLTVVFY